MKVAGTVDGSAAVDRQSKAAGFNTVQQVILETSLSSN